MDAGDSDGRKLGAPGVAVPELAKGGVTLAEGSATGSDTAAVEAAALMEANW